MPAQRRNSQIISIPAPIGGWNVRDPLPMMPPAYAPVLDNVFCLPSEIMLRKGYSEFATFTGTAETLFPYNKKDGTVKLYAAIANSPTYGIYDITSGGAISVAAVSGLSNARFKHVQFATTGGTFMYLVNGADSARLYDGTTWHAVTAVSSPYAITGVTTANLIDLVVHKRRLWFVEKDSMSAWYLPVDSVAGAAVEYDFGPLFRDGGYVVKIDTWSLDAGTGLDDYLVVFSSNGEVAVFTGTDPASASTWSLKGVFYIGAPLQDGRTCKYGGDLLILNRDGIAQMSKSLMSSRVNSQSQLTDKIQPQMSSDANSYSAQYGWEVVLYPPADMLIVNIPTDSGASYQYVMNTISGAWSRWTGLDAKSWMFADEQLYFGAAGFVGLAWDGADDDGNSITADILPAYQSFGMNSQLKRFTMMRALIGYDSSAVYGARMEVDFNLNPSAVSMPSYTPTTAGIYGVGKYGTASYIGQLQIVKQWKATTGMGYWASPHLMIESSTSEVRLYSIDLVMEGGGNF